MALPIVKSLADCIDFSKTVVPYIPQLYTLPTQVYEAVKSDPNTLVQLYVDTNPVIFSVALACSLAPIFLLVSELNKNYSQVDRFWSILPTLFNAHFVTWAHLQGLPTRGLDTLLASSIVWSMRLTFNYWRKGGYSIGSEDYRWEVVHDFLKQPLFFLFNVVFISLLQLLLLLSVTLPTYILLLVSQLSATAGSSVAAYDTVDLIFSRLLVALVMLAFFADQQQWDYQSAKASYRQTAKLPSGGKFTQEDFDRGFLTKGLFGWSRHPNFAAEQAFWVTLYAWSCFKTESLYNWAGIGAVLYLILFQGSTWLTELLSCQKYPEYREYQALVPRFLPKLSLSPVKLTPLDAGTPSATSNHSSITTNPSTTASKKNSKGSTKSKPKAK